MTPLGWERTLDMMLRATFLRCLAALGLAASGLFAHKAITTITAAEETAPLNEQLKNGLQARRPEDRLFCERVAQMVENNQLPVDLVKGTFQWARTRKKPYPFPYFEKALRLRAAELGIEIQ
jgi:hypothetical protein